MKVGDRKVIGANIASIRRQLLLSQRDLASRLHVHQTMVARWELGQAIPRRETLAKIAEALEVSVDDLIKGPELSVQALRLTEDPELNRLLSLINTFEVKDRDALKIFLEAIAMKNRMKQALSA